MRDVTAEMSNTKQTSGACGTNIINQNGNVTFKDNICIINEAPKEIKENLDSLANKYNSISDEINKSTRLMKDNETRLSRIEDISFAELDNANAKFKRLEENVARWKKNQTELLEEILTTMAKQDIDTSNYRQQLYDVQNTRFDNVDVQLSSLRESLITLELRVLRVETKVLHIQTDVSKLMEEVFTDGYDKSIFFYGISMGTIRANDEDNPLFGVNVEWVLPKLNFFWRKNALTGEVLKLSLKETVEFETLPGLPKQTIKNDLDAILVGGGLKLFLTESHFPFYTGVTLGLSTGDIETPYAGVSLGVEYFTRSARLLLEYRYQYFDSVDLQSISFNNFGDAERTVTSSSVDGHMLTIKLLFR